MNIQYKHVQGGGVPGGHNVILSKHGNPFITPMKECASIPLHHDDVIADIGAYVGTYAIRCARFPVQKVIAYEPTKATFDILNLTRLPNLHCINKAIVHDSRRTVEFFHANGCGVTNSTIEKRGAEKTIVECAKYDDAIRGASIVKIDIEGGEYDLNIIQPSVRALIIDFHSVVPDWKDRAENIIKQILSAGFTTVVKPNWDCGWTKAGSWVRDVPGSGIVYSPMMDGLICCGCGCRLVPKGSKSICIECSMQWNKQHQKGFLTTVGY